tara:strand:- start:4 stop:270 length:267 start_codon:yes stop_codon:yes gene_type:complete
MKSIIAAFIASLTLAGCTSNEIAQATHYWDGPVQSQKYTADEAACLKTIGSETVSKNVKGNAEFLANSAAFETYKACMLNKSYVLRTY